MNRKSKQKTDAGAGYAQNHPRPTQTSTRKRKSIMFALGLAGLCLASVGAWNVLFPSGPSAAPDGEVVDDNAAAEPDRPAQVRNDARDSNPRSEQPAPTVARVLPSSSQPWLGAPS